MYIYILYIGTVDQTAEITELPTTLTTPTAAPASTVHKVYPAG